MANKTMRTRNLDPTKPMAIYDNTKNDQPYDRIDPINLLRNTTSLPTGMEKEEESEHHLQMAIMSQSLGSATKLVAIPIPDVVIVESTIYGQLYPSGYTKESDLYRVQGLSAGPEPDVVDYCIDEEDDAWLRLAGVALGISVDRFETALDRLEKATGAQIPTEADAVRLLKERPEVAAAVYDFWLNKRNRFQHPLINRVRTENKRDSTSGHDPYVAFRRRAEKMQTRKNRKSDEQNYILMFKMRIAHTQLMRDGLLDILKAVKEREALKLRMSLIERQEYQLSKVVLNDLSGDYYNQIVESYPELSSLDAENAEEVDGDEEDEYSHAGEEKPGFESLEDMSDVSSSDNASSWSDARGFHHTDPRRSPRHLENDENFNDFVIPMITDPNLVPESQYIGNDPPDYWGRDGEFTFVPRKDCKYVESKLDGESEDEEDHRLDGFFLQDVPVVIDGQTVMKTVCGRRTYGLSGTRLLEYYKLPPLLDSLDLEQLLSASPRPEKIDDNWTNVLLKNKERVYVFNSHEEPPGSPSIEPMSDAVLEEIWDFVQHMPMAPSDVTPPTDDEEVYQIACGSTCQPVFEHNYSEMGTSTAVDRSVGVTNLNEPMEVDSEDVTTAGSSSDAENHVESVAVSAPATPMQLGSDSDSVLLLGTPQISSFDSAATAQLLSVSGKRKRPKSEVNGAVVKRPPLAKPKEGGAKKPPRKKAKPNGIMEHSPLTENRGGIFSVTSVMVPSPIVIQQPVNNTVIAGSVGIIRKPPPQKRKTPAKKPNVVISADTASGLGRTDSLTSSCDGDSDKILNNKNPKKKPAEDNTAIVLASLVPQKAPPSPQRPILPLPNTINISGVLSSSSSSTLTFSPTPLRNAPLNRPTTTYNNTPGLQALLATVASNSTNPNVSGGSIVSNGFHSAAGNPVIGLGMGMVSHGPKLC